MNNMQRLFSRTTAAACSIVMMLCAVLLTSCDDQTGSIGADIMPDNDSPKTSQAVYNLTTASVLADSLIAFTSDCYLGKITDPETNATTTADFVAQFATLENDKLPDISVMHKENGKVVADSIIINMYIKSYYGDSVNSIKIGVYELDPDNILPESKNYYTNLDPQQYVSKKADAVKTETTFSVVDLAIDDTIRFASTYSKNIRIKLPAEYGTTILQKYYEHPEYFKNSYNFIHNVMPGFYFKTLAGNGTMVNIDVSTITVFFRYQVDGKTEVGIKRVAATKEVIQCNSFSNQNLMPLINDESCTYIKSPAAIFTEATLPVNDIYKGHESDSVNSAKIVFTRQNTATTSTFALSAPQKLLMVRKADLSSFFENKKVPDNVTSYVTTLNSSYNSYTFSNIAGMVSYLHRLRNSGAGIKSTDSHATVLAKTAAWEANNPDWNKVVLVPVTTNTNSLGSVIDVYHDFSLASTKLVGGANNPISISVVYSSFK